MYCISYNWGEKGQHALKWQDADYMALDPGSSKHRLTGDVITQELVENAESYPSPAEPEPAFLQDPWVIQVSLPNTNLCGWALLVKFIAGSTDTTLKQTMLKWNPEEAQNICCKCPKVARERPCEHLLRCRQAGCAVYRIKTKTLVGAKVIAV